MYNDFITPISRMQTLTEISQNVTKTASTEDTSMFHDIFQNAVEDVTATQANLEEKQYLLATGQIDDAHTVTTAAAEAQLTVDMLVQIRNLTLEAYNELIRINL